VSGGRRLRRAALAWVTLLASGCVSGAPVDRSELDRLKNEPPITVVRYRTPDFFVRIPEGSYPFVGGYVYLATARDAGNKMIGEYGLTDPSLSIRDRLLSALAGDLDIKAFDVVPDPLESDSLGAIRSRFPNRVVLDLKTDFWTLHGSVLSSQRRLAYLVRARLIRTAGDKVVWEGWCGTGQDESTSRTFAEFTADNGALLKARLDEVAGACTALLRAQLLRREKEVRVK
jgi:hypothetical protein